MSTTETKPLSGDEMTEFLTGQFSVWFASSDGRQKTNASDKRLAKIVARTAVDIFTYYVRMRKRKPVAPVAA